MKEPGKDPEKEPGYYAIIPAAVRYCQTIPAGAKLLYGEITALSNAQGYCWANNNYFARLYQVNNKTISRWIKALADLDFIKIEIENYYQRKLFILEIGMDKNALPLPQKGPGGMDKNAPPLPQKGPGGMDKKVIHNNIINSTVNNTVSETALDFLKSNYPGRMEAWEMKFKNQIQDYNKFCQDFNSTVDIEELKFNDRVLFARLDKYANNWIKNQNKFKTNQPQPESIPVYLRKCK